MRETVSLRLLPYIAQKGDAILALPGARGAEKPGSFLGRKEEAPGISHAQAPVGQHLPKTGLQDSVTFQKRPESVSSMGPDTAQTEVAWLGPPPSKASCPHPLSCLLPLLFPTQGP